MFPNNLLTVLLSSSLSFFCFFFKNLIILSDDISLSYFGQEIYLVLYVLNIEIVFELLFSFIYFYCLFINPFFKFCFTVYFLFMESPYYGFTIHDS
jgi:hypothetical protein